jgi:hypothetical protein
MFDCDTVLTEKQWTELDNKLKFELNLIVFDLKKEGYRVGLTWEEDSCRLILSRLNDDLFDIAWTLFKSIKNLKLSMSYTVEWCRAIESEYENRIFEKIVSGQSAV